MNEQIRFKARLFTPGKPALTHDTVCPALRASLSNSAGETPLQIPDDPITMTSGPCRLSSILGKRAMNWLARFARGLTRFAGGRIFRLSDDNRPLKKPVAGLTAGATGAS